MWRRRAGLFCLVTGMSFSACSRSPEKRDPGVNLDALALATTRARETLPDFLDRFAHPEPGDEAFHFKVRLRDENGEEYIWLSEMQVTDTHLKGIITNVPLVVKNVQVGDAYSCLKSEIIDWMYVAKGKMRGNFTLRATLPDMDETKARRIREKVGW